MSVGQTKSLAVWQNSSLAIRYCALALVTLAVLYAFLAGFRTVNDPDTGWQLATGRWVIQHGEIPSTDVFSYTGRGRPWIYPVFSGFLLYILYLLGGYSALSWLTALSSAITVFLLTRGAGFATAALAVVAAPVIACRAVPRGDLFSTVLFAAFVSVLWAHYRNGSGKLWLLPILTLIWTNLHWGFVAGWALCAGYVFAETADFLCEQRRSAVKERLKSCWPWLLACAITPIANPWGLRTLGAVIDWGAGLRQAQTTIKISEFSPLRVSWPALQQVTEWRHPGTALQAGSAFWWLWLLAIIAAILALVQRRLGAAAMLLAAVWISTAYVRFIALFACLAVVIAGSTLTDLFEWLRRRESPLSYWMRRRKLATVVPVALTMCLAALVVVRASDLLSNRYYLRSINSSLFGAGPSWNYPERALNFIEREHLPGNIINDYNIGGYVIWRLPQYPDYIDGRGVLDPAATQESIQLFAESPESLAWWDATERFGINTIVVGKTRYDAAPLDLKAFCRSRAWSPVYLDEISAVLVRRRAETATLIERLQLDCSKVTFSPPSLTRVTASRARGELFNFWSNAAWMLHALDRDREALDALGRAQAIFFDNGRVHYLKGLIFEERGMDAEAEQELRLAAELDPLDANWFTLGKLYARERKYLDAAKALERAAGVSADPEQIYAFLAVVHIESGNPKGALGAVQQARRLHHMDYSDLNRREFHAELAEIEAHAWWDLGDSNQATTIQERAVKLNPENAKRWRTLASIYELQGRTADAQHARQRAQEVAGK